MLMTSNVSNTAKRVAANAEPNTTTDVAGTEGQDFSQPWMLSDAILIVEGQEFHVHRCILGMASDYFKTMFITGGFKENKEGKAILQGEKQKYFKELLYAIYPQLTSSPHQINSSNCYSMLRLACKYLMEPLKVRCVKFLIQFLENVKQSLTYDLSCLILAEHHNLVDLKVCCVKILGMYHLEELKKETLYKKLSTELKLATAEARVAYLEGCCA